MAAFFTSNTSSFLFKLNNFLILVALFGPNLLPLSLSSVVRSGRSYSPFFTIVNERTLISGPTMHPRTDFFLRSPVLRGL